MKNGRMKMDSEKENINEQTETDTEVKDTDTADTADVPETVENDTEKSEKPDKAEKKKGAVKEDKKLRAELAAQNEKVKELEESLADMTDKYMRVCAEYDNFRKRSKNERDAVYGDAVSDTLKQLLPIIDNLQLAATYSEGDKLAEGVQMILRTVPDVLDKLGITSFGEMGETFDPTLHNAVMHEEDESLGENEICEVLQRGYRHGDKIIRYAMVKVAN